MNTSITAQIWRTQICSPFAKFILLSIAAHANEQGVCRLSSSQLAEACELSPTSVQCGIDDLKRWGLLNEETNTDGDDTLSAVYVLIPEVIR